MTKWKDINHKVKVNIEGVVFLKKRNRNAVCGVNSYGYKQINLGWTGEKMDIRLVHRLIAQSFIPNPKNKSDVNHINGNKLDNRVENLEWTTRSENTIHQWKTGLARTPIYKLKPLDILKIKRLYKTGKYSQYKLGGMFGVSQPHIGDIILGQRWKHFT